MNSVVVDTSALLAYLKQEPGGRDRADDIRGALLCSVNLAETIGVLLRQGTPLDTARKIVELSEVQIVGFDSALAEDTGALIVHTRSKGLSLGDRACLALAARENLPALTADNAWFDLKLGIEIRFVR
jgi:ribonuclease VapC